MDQYISVNKLEDNSILIHLKKVVSNFSALFIIQGANYLLPLITIPYLLRVIHIEHFGEVSVSLALIHYFVIITDYSFNISATREVARLKGNLNAISSYYSRIFFTRLFLLLISLILFIVIVFAVPEFRGKIAVFAGVTGIVIGQTLQPVWLFQGIEKMQILTLLSFLSKLITTIFIFSFIQKEGDYTLVPIFYSVGFLSAGILSLVYAHKIIKVRFVFNEIKNISVELKNGWHLFLSNIAVNIYTVSASVILALFSTDAQVGYFSLAEKIINALKAIPQILFQAIYPRAVAIASNIDQLKNFFQKIFIPGVILFLAGSTLLFFTSGLIISILAGEKNVISMNILKIMAFIPTVILVNIPFYQILLVYNQNKTVSFILIGGSFTSLVLTILMVILFKATGAAISMLITEILVLLLLVFAAIKYIRSNTIRNSQNEIS